MLHILVISSLALYILAALGYVYALILERASSVRFSTFIARAGFLTHSVSLILLLLDTRFVLMKNGADFYFLVSWVLSTLFFAASFRVSFPIVGALLMSVTSLFLVSSSYLVHRETEVQSSNSTDSLLIGVHVLPALVAEVSLILAFVCSLVFLMQERRLKSKMLGSLKIKAPSLDLLDGLNRQLVLVGFVAMTLAVLSGSLWALSESKPLLRYDLMQMLSLISWLLLAIVIYSRRVLKWSARVISKYTVVVVGLVYTLFIIILICRGSGLHGTYS